MGRINIAQSGAGSSSNYIALLSEKILACPAINNDDRSIGGIDTAAGNT